MRFALPLFLLATVLLAPGVRAEEYVILPEPAWVTRMDLPAHTTPSAMEVGDVVEILVDVQVNRTIDPPETYFRNALQAVNELGVPRISQLAVSFNPAYQKLLIHSATIHRGGIEIPVPIRGHMRILHREEQLERQIYDGALTAVLLVEDVRPGDIVDWSWTLRGSNPVLGHHYSAQWMSTAMTPVGLLHRRLLWPATRPLNVISRGAEVQPTVTRHGDVVEYVLLIRDLPEIQVEPGVPDWYDALRPIVFTDVSSWQEVASWGSTLFPAPATLSPAMRARVAEFARAGRFPEERAMAAVRFVQTEIRYLGLEIGENSHRATAPDVVLARRFGDCKDKALLLVTFLRALGFEAHPALVNTSRRDSIVAFGPSALSFDHVIVRTRSEGKTYWIDATNAGQRGDVFARMPPPPYGVALVLSDTTRALSRILPDRSLALTTIEKKIDASRPGEPALLTVQTDFYGDGAAASRMQLLGGGLEQMSRSYLQYYRLAYPKIIELQPPVIEDDEPLNRVRIVERYSIPDFWKLEEGEDRPYADVSAFELSSQIPAWRGPDRVMPLGLSLPHRTIYTATIDMPHDVGFATMDKTIRTPALSLVTRKSASEGRYSIYHDFVRSRDYLTAEETNAAVEDFETMELMLGTEIGREQAMPEGGLGIVLSLVTALMAAALTLLVVIGIHRAPMPATIWRHTDYGPTSEPWTPDQPIGGWLYVFGFGVAVAPLAEFYSAAVAVVSASDMIGTGLTGTDTVFSVLALIDVGLAIAGLVYGIGLLVLFLQRRRIFFRAYVGAVALSVVGAVSGMVSLQLMSPGDPALAMGISGLLSGLVAFLLWSAYFVKSRRVEATFVR